METTTIRDLLEDLESNHTPMDLDLGGDVQVMLPHAYKATDYDLTVWAWESGDGQTGFVRDDSVGWHVVCLDDSRDDQLRLAAWNADFDIRILKDHLTDDQIAIALEDAQKNQWGYDGHDNIWD